MSRLKNMFRYIFTVIFLVLSHSAAAYDLPTLPKQLSQLNLFLDLPTLIPNLNTIPYGVNFPLWSDAANKQRWVYLPAGKKITYDQNQNFIFPVGTIFVKQFDFERKVETRVGYISPTGLQMASYVWQADQKDATLTEDEVITSVHSTASNGAFDWAIPSRQDCMTCHAQTSPEVSSALLGFSKEQLGKAQMENWIQSNKISDDLADLNQIDYLPVMSEAVDPIQLESMARGYLAVNCSSCHQPAGFVPTNLDFRWNTRSVDMNAIGVAPNFSEMGFLDPKIIEPGVKEQSLVWIRMNANGSGHMPYLGSKITDPLGLELVGRWIDSLDKSK